MGKVITWSEISFTSYQKCVIKKVSLLSTFCDASSKEVWEAVLREKNNVKGVFADEDFDDNSTDCNFWYLKAHISNY